MTKALADKRLRAALACATALTFAACSEQPFDVESQINFQMVSSCFSSV